MTPTNLEKHKPSLKPVAKRFKHKIYCGFIKKESLNGQLSDM